MPGTGMPGQLEIPAGTIPDWGDPMEVKRQEAIWIRIACIAFACLILVLAVLAGLTAGIQGPGQRYQFLRMNCSGPGYVFLARPYSDPITQDEMDAWKARITRNYLDSGGKFPGGGMAGGTGGAGCYPPCDPRTVEFGFYIDRNGTPHGMSVSAGNNESAMGSFDPGEQWYRDNIVNNSYLVKGNCTG
jgi:hypothetical protein